MAQLDLASQELLQDARTRAVAPLTRAERRAELLLGGGFAAAVALLWLVAGTSGDWNPVMLVAYAAAFALAALIRFEAAGIHTAPTQLVFVPLLLQVPPQAVPLVVLAAVAASRLPEVLSGQVPVARLLLSPANAWFSVGPAGVVLAAGGGDAVLASPALLAAIVAAQIGVDFATSSLREAVIRGATLREQVGDAVWVYAVDAALTPVAFATAAMHPAWSFATTAPLLALLVAFSRERRERLESAMELTGAYRGMAVVLGDVVEADDQYTGEHCRDVVDLAVATGRRLGLDRDRMRNLEFGALLHDVGKVAVAKEIINKRGPLTPEEYEAVKAHTVLGQAMLDRVGGFMRDVGLIVRHHHERWDGGGYPDALAGEAIPLEARIVACCDTFNAMTTDRSYRRALPHGDAIAELRRCAGSQFDPAVVDAVVAALDAQVPFVATLAAPSQRAAAAPEPPMPHNDRHGHRGTDLCER